MKRNTIATFWHKRVMLGLLCAMFFGIFPAIARGYYPSGQRPDHIMLYATPALSRLQYQSVDASSRFTPVLNVGIEYAHFIHHKFGFSIGAEYNNFAAKYSFDDRRDSLQMFDAWSGYHYKLRQQLYTTEHQRVSYLSIPLKLHFRQLISPKVSLNMSAGMVLNTYLTEKRRILSGTINRQAYFNDIHVNVDDFHPLLFGKFNNYINPSSLPQFGVSRTYTAQIGLSFQLNEFWALHTELNYQYGTKNIKQRNINILVPDEYAGITATNFIGDIKPHSLGLKIGLAYTFDLFDVDCKCQNSWWKL